MVGYWVVVVLAATPVAVPNVVQPVLADQESVGVVDRGVVREGLWYFQAYHSATFNTRWQTDGTSSGTRAIVPWQYDTDSPARSLLPTPISGGGTASVLFRAPLELLLRWPDGGARRLPVPELGDWGIVDLRGFGDHVVVSKPGALWVVDVRDGGAAQVALLDTLGRAVADGERSQLFRGNDGGLVWTNGARTGLVPVETVGSPGPEVTWLRGDTYVFLEPVDGGWVRTLRSAPDWTLDETIDRPGLKYPYQVCSTDAGVVVIADGPAPAYAAVYALVSFDGGAGVELPFTPRSSWCGASAVFARGGFPTDRLLRTDGTAVGTIEVPLGAVQLPEQEREFQVSGERLWFRANEGAGTMNALYVADRTVRKIAEGVDAFGPRANDVLFTSGHTLSKADVDQPSAQLVKDLRALGAPAVVNLIQPFGDRVVVAAAKPGLLPWLELWSVGFDGAAPTLLTDLSRFGFQRSVLAGVSDGSIWVLLSNDEREAMVRVDRDGTTQLLFNFLDGVKIDVTARGASTFFVRKGNVLRRYALNEGLVRDVLLPKAHGDMVAVGDVAYALAPNDFRNTSHSSVYRFDGQPPVKRVADGVFRLRKVAGGACGWAEDVFAISDAGVTKLQPSDFGRYIYDGDGEQMLSARGNVDGGTVLENWPCVPGSGVTRHELPEPFFGGKFTRFDSLGTLFQAERRQRPVLIPTQGEASVLTAFDVSPVESIPLEDGSRIVVTVDPVVGEELFVFDPVAGRLSLLADLEPGVPSSWPRNLTRVGDRLYFWATRDGVRQLFFVELTPQQAVDAGTGDAGSELDAGVVDAGMGPIDAGTGAPMPMPKGCGCTSAPASFVLLALVSLVRSRSRR